MKRPKQSDRSKAKTTSQKDNKSKKGSSNKDRIAKRNLKNQNKSAVEKDFDKFRHEIFKLGLTGLDKKDQVDARVELAIKLGAKPKSWIKKHTPLGSSIDSKAVSRSKSNKQDGKT